MLSAVKQGVEITPLLTVGDVLPSGYRFEAIPDGISVLTRGQGSRPLREPRDQQGAVPVQRGGAYGGQRGERLRQRAGEPADPQPAVGVLNGSFAIASSPATSASLQLPATKAEGFKRPILFTNEESPDYVYRQEASWPPTPGSPEEEEAGLVVALDVKTGKHRPIYGMGRHNHENSVPIPGYGQPVVFSG